MRIFTSKQLSITTSVILVSALVVFTPNFASAEDQGQGQGKDRAQARQEDGKLPQVRFGNPSKTINSDADQQEYDRQDGGIAGVNVLGSRVFEIQVINSATPRVTSPSPNLVKHSGNPMPVTHIYSIYWGSSFLAGYQSDVDAFLGTIGNSANNLNGVMTQYMNGGIPNQTSFGTLAYGSTFFDSSSNPPTSAPTTASILTEVYKVVTASGKAIDPAGLYMVFTNNYPKSVGYCAWHGAGSVSSSPTFTIAYQPFLGGTPGCSANSMANYSKSASVVIGLDAIANVASHEIYETITDPYLNAWYDSKGAEIADKCSWYFGSTKVGTYSVQTEWSNSAKACVAK